MPPQDEVRDFYETVGWQKYRGGLFKDALLFEDLREVSREYIHKCHLRLNRYLPSRGTYLLDVASGPIQYPEYLTYSQNFDFRLCADISLTALKEAKERLGDRGRYVLADITALPIKDNCLDTVLSLHTIYHVAAEKQLTAFAEIYRVLKPQGRALVVYAWGRDSILLKMIHGAFDLFRRTVRRMRGQGGDRKKGEGINLYFYAHPKSWFAAHLKERLPYEIFVWRSLSISFLRIFIRPRLLGKNILAAIYWLEERYPHFMGTIGKYPLIVIDKKSSQPFLLLRSKRFSACARPH